jgi:hypothetical protein
MIPWSTDAREAITDLNFITDDAVQETVDIQRFLHQDRFRIVVASKGFGKSLLLLAKRKSLQGVHHVVPYDRLLDILSINVGTLSRDARSILYDREQFSKLWAIAIAVVAVRAIPVSDTATPRRMSVQLQHLLSDESCRTVAGTLNAVLHLSCREFAKLCDDNATTLVPMAQDIAETVAIFIDNVDECFREQKDLLYIAQASLIEAVYHIVRLNPRIRPYVSIRKEAYLRFLPESEMGLQYANVCLQLEYSKGELKEIFEKNIRADPGDVLVDRSALRSDPVKAFVGTTRIVNGFVVEEEEDTFDYIYRHTLRRPRDLMEIGATIARIPVAERRPDTVEGMGRFREAVNDAGSRICDSYLQEVMPHLNITMADCDRICRLIPANVLTAADLKHCCMVFNGDNPDCQSEDCMNCTHGTHVFCELYKAGLLGVVSDHLSSGATVQDFPLVGEKVFAETPALPEADYYLINPVLDDRIRKMNPSYRKHTDSANIVGYDRLWHSSRIPPVASVKRPLVFIISTTDMKAYRDIAEAAADEERFEVQRGECDNSPEGLRQMRDLALRCHLLIAILGPRYGEVVDGKSLGEHEFEAALSDNPAKILVYFLEAPSNRWELPQLAFLERIQALSAGGPYPSGGAMITSATFKQRLRKDILERTAYLMRSGRGGAAAGGTSLT